MQNSQRSKNDKTNSNQNQNQNINQNSNRSSFLDLRNGKSISNIFNSNPNNQQLTPASLGNDTNQRNMPPILRNSSSRNNFEENGLIEENPMSFGENISQKSIGVNSKLNMAFIEYSDDEENLESRNNWSHDDSSLSSNYYPPDAWFKQLQKQQQLIESPHSQSQNNSLYSHSGNFPPHDGFNLNRKNSDYSHCQSNFLGSLADHSDLSSICEVNGEGNLYQQNGDNDLNFESNSNNNDEIRISEFSDSCKQLFENLSPLFKYDEKNFQRRKSPRFSQVHYENCEMINNSDYDNQEFRNNDTSRMPDKCKYKEGKGMRGAGSISRFEKKDTLESNKMSIESSEEIKNGENINFRSSILQEDIEDQSVMLNRERKNPTLCQKTEKYTNSKASNEEGVKTRRAAKKLPMEEKDNENDSQSMVSASMSNSEYNKKEKKIAKKRR